ncbi:hypothetical protein PLICRDRAFT_695354 [Plicaturopsis crispa FD-325 SS-3]|nr:hypothetical protein PLICRDRAFT_695354 [Plicaturopsis crispa FD-325 SS-3]
MPSATRTLLIAVHAVAFSALVVSPFATTSALASPAGLPMPIRVTARAVLTREANDSSRKSMRIKHAVSHNHTAPVRIPSHPRNVAVAAARPTTATAKHRRNSQGNSQVQSNVNAFNDYYTKARTHSSNLKNLASQSANVGGDDKDFQQKAATEMTGFQTNFLGFQNLLGTVSSGDKGLANYDRSDLLETQIKGLINANKDVLSATTALVYNIPVLGPILGPIVYEIKCIVDDLLDITEDVTDGLLNALTPLLQPLLGQADLVGCGTGLDVFGVCL